MPEVPPDELLVARSALDRFAVPADAAIAFVKFRENHVYRVSGPGYDYSLRMHRPGYRTDAHLYDEVATLDRLARQGVAVPVPVTTDAGDFVAVVTDAAGRRRQATLQAWIDGARGFGDSGAVFEGAVTPDAAELAQLGALIAQLHALASKTGTPEGYGRPAWNVRGLTGPTALWGVASSLAGLDDDARRVLDAADARVAEALADLPTGPDAFGVIHADMTFENVLVSSDGLIALDFDDSGEGWYLFDLATTAFWCTPHPQSARLVQALFDGYTARRPLAPADLGGWDALLLARGLSYLGWAAERPDDPTSAFHLDVLAPWIVEASRRFLATGATGWPVPTLHEKTTSA